LDDDLDLTELRDDDLLMLYLAAAALTSAGARSEDPIWLKIEEEARRRGIAPLSAGPFL
jgi:hypothetical protein